MKLHYSSCGQNGHLSGNCFRTLGYPEWWGEPPRARINSGRGRGYAGGSFRPSEAARAHAVQVAVPA